MIFPKIDLEDELEEGYIAKTLVRYIDIDVLCDEIQVIMYEMDTEQLRFIIEKAKDHILLNEKINKRR